MPATVTLSEDDLYRLTMALHHTLAYWDKMRATAPSTAAIVSDKYRGVFDKINHAYQQCVTEGRK